MSRHLPHFVIGVRMSAPRRAVERRTTPGRAIYREVEVVAAVLATSSEKTAAQRVGLSHSTVKHHLRGTEAAVAIEPRMARDIAAALRVGERPMIDVETRQVLPRLSLHAEDRAMTAAELRRLWRRPSVEPDDLERRMRAAFALAVLRRGGWVRAE